MLNPLLTLSSNRTFVNRPSAITGAVFDGSSRILRGGALTGAVSSKTFTIACQFKLDIGATSATLFHARSFTDLLTVTYNSIDNKLLIAALVEPGIIGLNANTSSGSILPDVCYSLLYAANAVTGQNQLYINDSSDLDFGFIGSSDIILTGSEWTIGASVFGSAFVEGKIKFFRYDDKFYDMSIVDNRRLFFSSQNTVNLSPTSRGEVDLNGPPLIYVANTADIWHTNKGTGGGFTVAGTLTVPSSTLC